MMNNRCREIGAEEFEALAGPIFQSIEVHGPERLDLGHFVPEWKRWVGLGFARTWVSGNQSMAGGVFTKDLFTGEPRASLMFWVSTPAARRTGNPIRVLRAFEQAAGGTKKAVAFHRAVSPEPLGDVYIKRGYTLTELIFTKR
jgi:hypothetical protein